MTKQQKEIYNWLLDKPGYLKKSALYLQNNYFKGTKLQDIYDSLLEARFDYKLGTADFEEESVEVSRYKVPKAKSKIYNKDNVLVIADTHFPFEKEGYLEHCLNIRDKYNCGTIVHIGDEVDLCGISQWEKDPDGFSAGTEASLAQEKMKIWYKAFPEVKVCIGNHTARPFRLARANGMPKKFIKTYEDAWEAPKGWKWAEHWEIDGVLYTHGTGFSGANAAIRIATRHRQNTVVGHIHSEAGVQYLASKIDLIWGLQVGGALDDSSYAAYYAKDQLKKSIVGCGVVLDKGKLPLFEPMIL
jgi:predicted phosphodiesterase